MIKDLLTIARECGIVPFAAFTESPGCRGALVSFERALTDGELRALHDLLATPPAPAAQAGDAELLRKHVEQCVQMTRGLVQQAYNDAPSVQLNNAMGSVLQEWCKVATLLKAQPAPEQAAQGVVDAPGDDEVAWSAAASEANKRGIGTLDAWRIVVAYLAAAQPKGAQS